MSFKLKKYLSFLSGSFILAFSRLTGVDHHTDQYTDARYIAKNYLQGVVKILVYDPVIEKKFNLAQGDGYLTRGSGFFVTPDGVIFTNRHVIEWCVYGYAVADWVDESGKLHQSDVLTYKPGLELRPEIKKIFYIGHAIPLIQVFNDEKEKSFELYRAQVLTIGDQFDGAMLKVVSDLKGSPVQKQFRALPLGDSNKVVLGEDLVVLGYPSQYQKSDFALDLKDTITMSYGKHSGWDYVFDDVEGFIKTNASVHEGNSGGPVFGDEESVIGIATAMGTRTQIGLVAGINGMYYVAEPKKEILLQLVKDGLQQPENGKRFRTLSGDPKPLPKLDLAAVEQRPNQRNLSVGSTPLKLKEQPAILFKGVVLNAKSHAAVAAAQISVSFFDKETKAYKLVKQVQSDPEGYFLFDQGIYKNGTYQISVKAAGYQELKQEMNLEAPQQFITIRLTPK